jgi:hypothetical protein
MELALLAIAGVAIFLWVTNTNRKPASKSPPQEQPISGKNEVMPAIGIQPAPFDATSARPATDRQIVQGPA